MGRVKKIRQFEQIAKGIERTMSAAPTEREVEILKVLWEIGESSIRTVHEHLQSVSGLHIKTIQTQMRIMDDKGLVQHRKDGRTFLYKAVCTRSQLSSRFVRKVYDGEVNELVLNMLQSEKLSEKELHELEKAVAEARKKKKGRKK